MTKAPPTMPDPDEYDPRADENEVEVLKKPEFALDLNPVERARRSHLRAYDIEPRPGMLLMDPVAAVRRPRPGLVSSQGGRP